MKIKYPLTSLRTYTRESYGLFRRRYANLDDDERAKVRLIYFMFCSLLSECMIDEEEIDLFGMVNKHAVNVSHVWNTIDE